MMQGTAGRGALLALARTEVDALGHACGLRLADYRAAHVERCVERAVAREPVADRTQLTALVARDDGARDRFRRWVAVSVSGMFRDKHQFDLLETELLPPLLHRVPNPRIWSAGSADGRELYSIGLLLQRAGRLEGARLLGSDLLAENVAAARAADYRNFTPSDALRRAVHWEQRDLLTDPAPPGAFDLILCRNVAIYLEPEARDQLHASLATALAPEGVLLLGRSERVVDPGGLGLKPAGRNAYRRCL